MNYDQMMKFCNPEDVRLFCTKPFSDGKGHMVATDGKIVVSCIDAFAAELLVVAVMCGIFGVIALVVVAYRKLFGGG